MTKVYPELPTETERRLSTIKIVAANDPNYFTDPKCPYSKELIDLLTKMIHGGDIQTKVEIFTKEMDTINGADTILEEVQSTIEEMKGIEKMLIPNTSIDPADKVAFYKAMTGLLEKWVQIKERTFNVKQMAEFQKLIITIMEEILDKDQQQEFKNKVKNYGK